MVTKRAKAQKVKEAMGNGRDGKIKEGRVRSTANGPRCKFGISCHGFAGMIS